MVGALRVSFRILWLAVLISVALSIVPSVAGHGTAGDALAAAPNTWIARTRTGRTFTGTWTVAADPTSDVAARGTWTLVDERGRVLARGGWSATKSPAGWTGAWRAAVLISEREYSGTWSADVALKKGGRFAELFERAAQSVVSGGWRYGRETGAWSIRAYSGQ